MSDQPTPNTIAALERIMQEIQNLVDHPRIQQRTSVAYGKAWLSILQIVHEELAGKRLSPATDETTLLPDNDSASIRVEVNAGYAQIFVNISLANVQQVEVYRGGEPGHRIVRGAHSGFCLLYTSDAADE